MIPAATIRGTFSTFEDSKQQDLNVKLGHCVDLTLENLITVELGGWGTMVKIHCINGSTPSINTNKDGSFSIVIQPTSVPVRTLESKVMTELTRKKAMPFLEIAAVTGSGIEELRKTIQEMENKDYVDVLGDDDDLSTMIVSIGIFSQASI